MRALARPHGRRDDHIPLRERGGAQADGFDEKRIRADGQVLTVLLERAGRDHAHGPRAAARTCVGAGELAESIARHRQYINQPPLTFSVAPVM